MSNLSELLPAGGAAKEFEPVASGTLPNGQAVVLKSNGQVEIVVESSTSVAESIPAGSVVPFLTRSTAFIEVAFDPYHVGQFIITYRDYDNSGYGTAIMGTVSGTSITFGASFVFWSGVGTQYAIAFDPNTENKFVIIYRQTGSTSNQGGSVAGTISGANLSFSSEVLFHSAETLDIAIAFDPNTAGKFVVTYRDESNSSRGTAVVGTLSGTSISYGSEYVFNSTGSSTNTSIAFDPNTSGKFTVAFTYSGVQAVVGTVSGTSLTFGPLYEVEASTSYQVSVVFDPNTAGKFIVVYQDGGNSYYGTSVVGTLSGTSISYGSEYVFNSGNSSPISIAFDPNTATKFIVTYKDSGNSGYGTLNVGVISGTALTYGPDIVFSSGSAGYPSIAFDPNTAGKFVVAYQDDSSTNKGTAVVGQMATTITTTNLTSTNFVGITAEAITSGATGVVVPQGGVATNLSSLTIGSEYYVQANGTVSTVSTSPAVNIGKAISATSLILKG
jgi:hypothetical protein